MKDELINKLKIEYSSLKNELEKKRFSLGEADSGKESRFPTQRVELENTIIILEDKVYETKQRIEELAALPEVSGDAAAIGSKVTFEYDGEKKIMLLVPKYGSFSDNVLSAESPLGKAIIGRHLGELFEINLNGAKKELKIVELA